MHGTMETPDDAITFKIDKPQRVLNNTEEINIINLANSSAKSNQTNKVYGDDYLIEGNVVFDMSDLKVNKTNNYTTPIDFAFKDLFKLAKSTNHYKNNSKHETGSNFFTNPSSENGGAFIAFYDNQRREVTRMNVADAKYDVAMVHGYDGSISVSNYSLPNNSFYATNFGNDCVGIKFNVRTDSMPERIPFSNQLNEVSSAPDNYTCELHIILKSSEKSGANDYYCYEVIVPLITNSFYT